MNKKNEKNVIHAWATPYILGMVGVSRTKVGKCFLLLFKKGVLLLLISRASFFRIFIRAG